jgi:hypothetical protein
VVKSYSLISLRFDKYKKDEKDNQNRGQDQDAFHLPVLALVALSFDQLFQALLHPQPGVLNIEVYAVHYFSLNK